MRALILIALSLLLAACGGYSNQYGGGMYGGMPASCPAGTRVVTVGAGPLGMSFSPSSLTVHVNDTVCWTWASGPHSVVSGTSCVADGGFCAPSNASCGSAPVYGPGQLYLHTFTSQGTFDYFCSVHCGRGMVGSVTVLP